MIFKITAQTDIRRPHDFFGTLRVSMDAGNPMPAKDPEWVERENAIKDVCLNCTRETCKGSAQCFRKERDKRR